MPLRLIALTLVLCLALIGCTTPRPLSHQSISDRRWQALLSAYESVVSASHTGSTLWHHNWLGNATVLNQGPPHKGLCWQWRDHLDSQLTPVIATQQFSALGIHAHRGTPLEHNALLVYDPAATTLSRLLSTSRTESTSAPVALVLDPWFTGTAAVYTFAEWSRLGSASHPIGIDQRPFPVGQLAPPTKRESSSAW